MDLGGGAGTGSVLDVLFGGSAGNQLGTIGTVARGALLRLAQMQQPQPAAGVTPQSGAAGAPLRPGEAPAPVQPAEQPLNTPIDWLTTDPAGMAAADRQRRQWGATGNLIGGVVKLAAAGAA